MHDPMTVAHEIRRPWPQRSPLFTGGRYWPSIVTIWHVDPERDGSDDSCDWFGKRRTRENGWYPGHQDEYEALPEESRRAIDFVWWTWGPPRPRPWYRHPRWHVWHWKVQVHVVQKFKRWMFSRCVKCGGRFRWGYTPIGSWGGRGPGWWFGREQSWHSECDPSSRPARGVS